MGTRPSQRPLTGQVSPADEDTGLTIGSPATSAAGIPGVAHALASCHKL
ncbi:hypothetical protein, partial [Frankia sp. EI5c]